MSLDLKEHRGPTSLGTPEADGICIWAVPKCDTIAAMKRAVVEWSTVDSHISYKLPASKLPAGETADKIQDLIGKLVRAGACLVLMLATELAFACCMRAERMISGPWKAWQ